MVYNYRVYVVMTPQTHLTIVIDDETFIEGVFVNLEPQIATAIQNAQAAGKDVTAAQAAFTDLKSQVSNAQAATNGQSTQILAQTPTAYPGNWQRLPDRTHQRHQRAHRPARGLHRRRAHPGRPAVGAGSLGRPAGLDGPPPPSRGPPIRRPQHRVAGRGAGRLRAP